MERELTFGALTIGFAIAAIFLHRANQKPSAVLCSIISLFLFGVACFNGYKHYQTYTAHQAGFSNIENYQHAKSQTALYDLSNMASSAPLIPDSQFGLDVEVSRYIEHPLPTTNNHIATYSHEQVCVVTSYSDKKKDVFSDFSYAISVLYGKTSTKAHSSSVFSKQTHPSLPGEIEKVTVERKGADNNLASISIYYSGYDDCIEHAYSAANDWLEQLARNAESYITKCGKAHLQDYITHCEGNEIELFGTIQGIGHDTLELDVIGSSGRAQGFDVSFIPADKTEISTLTPGELVHFKGILNNNDFWDHDISNAELVSILDGEMQKLAVKNLRRRTEAYAEQRNQQLNDIKNKHVVPLLNKFSDALENEISSDN